MKRIAVVGSVAAASAWLLFNKRARPWYVRWGATDDEVAASLPLDDRVPDATMVSTRAISIDAPPDRVWPWIVQIGDHPRAGYYSYAWIERMQGMRIENAAGILPQYQSLAVGDVLDRNGTIVVQYVDPGRALVVGPPDTTEGIRCTWAFVLTPVAGGTRLVTRVRANVSYLRMLRAAPPYAWPFLLLLDPGAFVMERKMLIEIKRHAESQVRAQEDEAVSDRLT